MTKTDKKSFNQSLAEWKLFIYNRTTGEFLGRTAKNWGLILLFNLVFYGFLAAVFSFTLQAMLQTLNHDEVPKYRHRIPSPGLRFFQNQCRGWIFDSACLIRNPIKGTLMTLRNF
jgi:sodium/potassium-transporting ATPase subunit beta